jgi:hypothetical protein
MGTSTKYFVAHSPSSGACRVHVRADPAAQLQISIRRLPADLPRLELHAARVDASVSNRGVELVQLRVMERNGTAVKLERLAWERSTRGTNRDDSKGYVSPVLREAEIEQLFGATIVPASGSLTSGDLQLGPEMHADEPIMFKITARDAAGRVISAWCPLHPARRSVEQTAAGSEPIAR